MPVPLPHRDVVAGLTALPGWVAVAGALHARWDPPDVPTAARLLAAVLVAAEEQDHHPDVDLRWRRLRFRLRSHDAGGVTRRDLRLAATISALAAEHGATQLDGTPTAIEVGTYTADVAALATVWTAALPGHRRSDGDGWCELVDPEGLGPVLWFAYSTAPAVGRNRLHVDVSVPTVEVAAARSAAIAAAGGVLVTDAHAPAWWVWSDPDGNELCVCTPFGRD